MSGVPGIQSPEAALFSAVDVEFPLLQEDENDDDLLNYFLSDGGSGRRRTASSTGLSELAAPASSSESSLTSTAGLVDIAVANRDASGLGWAAVAPPHHNFFQQQPAFGQPLMIGELPPVGVAPYLHQPPPGNAGVLSSHMQPSLPVWIPHPSHPLSVPAVPLWGGSVHPDVATGSTFPRYGVPPVGAAPPRVGMLQQQQPVAAHEGNRARPFFVDDVDLDDVGGAGNGESALSGSSMAESDERRARRLARNRESARQSRRRKKQYLELLEEKVAALSDEMDGLRKKHLEDAPRALRDARTALLRQLQARAQALDAMQRQHDALVATAETTVTPSEAASVATATAVGQLSSLRNQLARDLDALRDRFGPAAEERVTVSEYHFGQLTNLLLPPYTKFLLWVTNQGDDFFNNYSASSATEERGLVSEGSCGASGSMTGLWALLSNELGLTYEQEEKMKNQFRHQETLASRADRRKLSLATLYLSKLRQSMALRASAVQRCVDEIFAVLSPEQAVVYLSWLERHRDRLREFGFGRSPEFLSFTGVEEMTWKPNSDEAIDAIVSTLLNKPDVDLTLEDLATLLQVQAPYGIRESGVGGEF